MKRKDIYQYYTYELNRRCLYCGSPISDQTHKLRKFCPREVLPDHSIKNCKDDWHTNRKSKFDRPYRNLVQYHKKINRSILQLRKAKGDIVNAWDLNEYAIDLKEAIEKSNVEGIITFYFLKYKITALNTNRFKIEYHERKFK